MQVNAETTVPLIARGLPPVVYMHDFPLETVDDEPATFRSSRLDPLLSSKRVDYNTPEWFFKMVQRVNPRIVLDPCPGKDSCVVADDYCWQSEGRDGLKEEWWPKSNRGRLGMIYCNPPYGRALSEEGGWGEKLAKEGPLCEMIALLPARTDTRWYNKIRMTWSIGLLWQGRITFDGMEHPAPFPSLVAYWGPHLNYFRGVFQDRGHFIE